jgi:hypothetical protein
MADIPLWAETEKTVTPSVTQLVSRFHSFGYQSIFFHGDIYSIFPMHPSLHQYLPVIFLNYVDIYIPRPQNERTIALGV